MIDARDYALLYLCGRLGPRRISLGTLRWGSLVVEASAAVIAFHVKGDRYDRVLAPPDVLAVLATWHKELAVALGRPLRAEDAVFPPVGAKTRDIGPGSGAALEPMTTSSISYQVRHRFAHVGIVGPGFAAHALRATAATVAYENGATVEEIQAMLGHLNRPQTEAYIRRRLIRSAAARWVPGDGLDLPKSA